MILYRWQGAARNFGDELNRLLWPRLLPHFFDANPEVQFLGIGSILDARHSPSQLKLVAGSGYGGYERPSRLDNSWLIHWVRGPHTAALYGLPPNLALGDPATLVPFVVLPRAAAPGRVGFMPHFESAAHGCWQEATAAAGLRIIDPRGDPSAIVAEIAGCELIVSEALHGVIVADALRTPWIAVRPLAPIHRAKWQDWAAALSLEIRFHPLPASSLLEQAHASLLIRNHTGRKLLIEHADRLRPLWAKRFVSRATSALLRLKSQAPQLSSEQALDRSQTRMLERLEAVRSSAYSGAFQPAGGNPGGGIRVQACATS
jgi:succinoglycan biosynthesis protein ExoV